MSTLFTAELRGELLAQIRSGMGFAEACESVGLSVNTGKGWLRRGRQNPGTEYAAFADAVDQARDAAAAAEMTTAEFQSHVNTAVRRGSVQAMKLWLQINAPEFHGPDALDALRARRQQRRSSFDELDNGDGFIDELLRRKRNGHE